MTASAKSILIVEDEPTIAQILLDYLKKAGFAPFHLEDGRAALESIRRQPPDLVLLDLMLPGMDGLSVCSQVRTFSNVPIIMVTARVEEIDRLLGLEAGADDYICKPFSPREVVARVTAVLRRMAPSPSLLPQPALVEIDLEGQRISFGGKRLDLTPTEYRVLSLLAARPGRLFSRAQILDLAYPEDEDVSDRIVDSHIKNIRKKLAAILPEADVIHSVYGIGYRFEV
ncbi:MAG: response regulator [Alphaproteobacteria bacterium]|nr:response regulator [Alphaproteobacteria bacterium]